MFFKIAQENLKRDFFRRWWCQHYNLPPTDPRLAEYTHESLAIEFLEWALDSELIALGAEGMPVQEEDYNGETIYVTGFEDWDDEERRWADQKPVDELLVEKAEVDVLEQINRELDKET